MTASALPNTGLKFLKKILWLLALSVTLPVISGFASTAGLNNSLGEPLVSHVANSPVSDPTQLFSGELPGPGDVTICEGGTAVFSVATGATWQWQVSAGGAPFADITGQVAPTLTLTGVTYSMNGNQYQCIIDGVANFPNLLTVNPTPAVTNGNTATICSGSSPNFSLSATVPSTFSWTLGTNTGGITGASAASGLSINQTLTNPSNLTAGSIQYIVTPTSVTGGCVGTPYTVTITVEPEPAVTTLATASICSGSTTNIALTSSVPSTFAWTIGTVTGAITGASAGSGPTISQVLTNPSNSGTGTVQYLVTPTSVASSCIGATFTITVTVNPIPALTSLAPVTICDDGSPNIALTATAASTFSWTIGTINGGITGASAGSGATINQPLANPVFVSAGSVDYIVTPTTTSGSCPGLPSTITVTVNPSSFVTSPNTATICSGTSPAIALTANMASTFSWTIGTITGGITGATAGSGATINQLLTNPSSTTSGSVDYIVTPKTNAGSCTGHPTTITVTVKANPVVTTANTSTICSGTAPGISLAASIPSTFTWTVGTITGGVSGASAGSGSTINQTLINPSNSVTGTVQYLVTPTSVAGSCAGSPYTITVSVVPKPVMTNAAAVNTCSNISPNLSLTASVPSNFSWTIGTITGNITGASSGSGSVINQVLTNPSSSTVGTVDYIVTPTSTAGSCVGNPLTITMTVNPIPDMTPIAPVTVCNGISTNITLASTAPSTYSWTIGTITGGITGAVAGSGSAISQVLTNPSSASSGTVTYIITPKSVAGNCPGNPYSLVVTVDPSPVLTTASTATLCSGSSTGISLTASVASTFSWTIGTITGGITGASAGSGPTINQTLNNPSNSASGTVQYLVTPKSIAAGTSCGVFTITVTVNPKPIITNSLTSMICSGSNVIIPLAASKPSNFSWTIGAITGGITGASPGSGTTINQNLTNPSGASAGTVQYIVTPTSSNDLCVGDPTIITVTVNPVPTITSPNTATICSGTSPGIALTANLTCTYAWSIGTVTGGITGASSGAGTVINQVLTNPSNVSAGTVQYIVTPTVSGGVCTGTPYVITVTVNLVPSVTNASAITTCSGASPNIVLTSSTPSTFTWTLGNVTGGISGASAGSGATINQTLTNPSNATSGTVQYIVTPTSLASGCTGLPYTITVTVSPKPIVTNAPTTLLCSGSVSNIVLAASAPSTYTWTVGTITGGITGASAASGLSINQTLTNPSNTVPGTVAYIVTPSTIAGFCSGNAYTIVATVNPAPTVTNLPTASTCSGTSPNIALTASIPSTFTWTIGLNTGGITGANAGSGSTINQILTNPSTTNPGTVEYLVTPTATNGSCPGAPYTITVTVNPSPAVTTSAGTTTCSGSSPNIALTASNPSTFAWTIGTITGGITGASAGLGSTINQVLTNPSNSTSGTVQYIVTPTAVGSSCTGSPYTITVTVLPKPSVNSAATVTMCSGTTSNIILTATIPSTYTWTVGTITGGIIGAGPGAGPIIAQNLVNPSITVPGTVAYIVTPTSIAGSCVGNPYTVTVTVNPAPVVTTAPAAITCSGTSPNILLSASAPSTFSWTIGANTGGISGASAGSGTIINQVLANPSTTIPGSIEYIVTPTATTGLCAGTPFTITVTVSPAPAVTTPASAITCSGTSPNIALTASQPSSFSWTIGTITGGITGASAGVGTSINQVLTNPGNAAPGTVQYIVTPTSTGNSCIGAPYVITVTVNPKPVVTNAAAVSVCSGAGSNISLTASIPSTFTWTVGTITGGITGAGGGTGPTINQILTNPSSSFFGTVAYVVTPTSVAGACIGNPYTITVTVNPSPVVTTLPTAITCSGTSPNISLTASAPSTFSWIVGANTGGITGASSGSGTIINQVLTNPSNLTPGSIEYIVTPTATTGVCAGTPYTITVTVDPAPTVTNAAAVSTCTGTSPNIALTGSIPSTYTWTVGAVTGGITGASAGVGPAINQVLTNPSNTLAGTVQYLVTPTSVGSLCAGVTRAITVTVNPAPVVTNPAAVGMCSGAGSNINLTASIPSTFTWTVGIVTGGITGAGAGAGSIINQVLTNPSGVLPGTVQYIITPTSVAGSCTGSPFTMTITVSPVPVLTSTLSPPAICSSTIFSYIPTGTAGSTFNWSRTAVANISNATASGTGNPNETLINTTTTPVTVTYVYTVSLNGCTNPVGNNVTVVVNPSPNLSSTLAPPAICNNSLFSYTPLSATPGTTFNWSRSLTPGISNIAASGTDNPNETLVNTTSSVINVTYVYTLSANGCSHVQNVVVAVNPTPILTSTLSPAAVCSGAVFNYVPTSTTAGFSAAWSRAAVAGISNATSSGTGSPNEILLNTTPLPVVVTYVYTLSINGCANPTTYSVNVTVNPTPALTSSLTPLPICSNTPFNYTPTSLALGTNFAWSRAAVPGISNSASSGNGNPNETLINTTSLPISVIYVYNMTTGSCSNIQNVVATINPTPVLNSGLTPPAICSGATFNYNPSSTTPATSFSWNRNLVAGISNAAASGAGNPNEILINTTSAPISVTYNFTLNSAGCSNTQNVVITVNPVPVLTSSLAPSSICSSSIFSYIPSSSTAGAVFNWSRATVAGISNTATSGVGNPNETLFNTTSLPVLVTYNYTVSFAGCTNPVTFPVVVAVNPMPVLTSTLTPAAICNNSVFNYIPGSLTPGTIFNWSRNAVPGISNVAASGTGNPGEVLINTTATPIVVNYTYTLSANGCSNNQNIPVTVNPTPVMTSNLNPTGICSNNLFSYVPTSSTVGTVFNWNRPFVAGISNAPAAGTGNPNEVLVNTTASPITVTYTYSLTANGCTNPATYAVNITVNPLPTLSSTLTPNAICSNSSFVYTATSANGVITGWSRAAIAGISNPSTSGAININETLVNTTALSINVTYAYTLTLGGCSNIQNVVVTVHPNPVLSGTLTPPSICSNSLFSYNPASISAGAVFNWSRVAVAGISNPTASGVGNPNEVLVNTTATAIPVTYTYQISANGCSSTQNVIVQVNPLPALTSTLLPLAICSNTVFSYTPTSSTPGTIFAWSRPAVAGITNAAASGNGNPNETLVNLTAASVNVTYVYTLSANGCSNPTTYSVVVAVNPSATLTSSLTPGAICSGSIFNYTATSSTPGAVLNWSRASSSGILQPGSAGSGNISEFLTSTSPLPVVVTYQYTLFVNGCISTQNVTLTVNPSPDLTSSLAPPIICSGSVLHYAATSSTPGVTFNWTRATVPGILQPATSGTGNVNEILTNTSAAPVHVTYVYTLTANSCSNASVFNVVVTVNPIPATPVLTASGPTTFCTGDEVILTAPAGFSYQWTTGESTSSIHVTTSGSFSVVVKDAAGCASSPSIPTLTTALPAPAPPTSGGDITQCIATPAQVIVPVATAPAGSTVKWYDAPTGGNLLAAPSFSGLGTKMFFAESVDNLTGCKSLARTQVAISIISHPAAPVKNPDIIECEKSPLQTLTATANVPIGSTINWYTAPSGGSPVTPTLHAVTTVSYYAETDNGICTSLTRTKVTLTINPAPAAPVSLGNITDCAHSPIQTLTALSSDPAAIWYTTASGGSPVSPTLNMIGSATYYAESTLGTCASLTRSAPVVLTLQSIPDPPVSGGDVRQCEQSPMQTLTATATPPPGATVKWYLTPTGGVPIGSPTISSVKAITYYAESDNGTCQSLSRTAVSLQIDAAPKPPIAGVNITQCENVPNIQTLTATATAAGSTILWYGTPTGGDPVSPTLSQVGTASYYAEASNAAGCVSVARSAAVVLTINPTPASPIGINVTQCATTPLQTLTAQTQAPPTGVVYSWYSLPVGGTTVASPILKIVGTKTYYAESKQDKCINPTRTPVVLTINNQAADPVLKVKGLDSLAICESAPMDTLDARTLFTVIPGVSYVFFDALTGGFEIAPTMNYTGRKTLYAEARTALDCPSFNRIPVKLAINAAPLAPVSTGDISECAKKPLQTLDANTSVLPAFGTKIVWYDKATGGNVVKKPILHTADSTAVYYAESVDSLTKCSSLTRTSVKLSLGSSSASTASNSPLSLGQTLQLKGGPDVPGNTFLWTDPSGFAFNTMDVIIPNVTASAAGLYKLTVTSLNGCTAIDSVNVILDIAKADAQKPVCIGGTLYLSALPDNMKSYAWSGPNGYTSSEQNPAINNVTISNSGTYTLVVTNANNATSSDTVSVSFKPLPIPVPDYTTVCPAGTMQLKAGPNGMTSYLWSGPGGFTSTLQNPPPIPFAKDSVTYKLTVVDWNGCSASKTITPMPFQPKATSNSPLCTGDTLRLRGEPNGMVSYNWSGPNNFKSTLQSPTLNNVNPATDTGDYLLTVVDKAGCTYSTKVAVSFNPAAATPTITPNINPICEGSTLILNGGPDAMASYDWSGPKGFISKDQNPSIPNMVTANAGKYTLKITNTTGCKSSFETAISVISVNFNGTYGPYCISDSPVTISVSPAGGTLSGPGITGNVFDPKVAGEGTHTIQYTYSASGGLCTIVATKYIDVVNVPNLVINNPVLKSCTGTTADLTLPAVTLGSTPGLVLTYWTDSKATLGLATPKNVAAGLYYIKGATSSGKCYNIQPVKVMQPDSLRAKIIVKGTDCYGDSTGTMEAVVTLGTAPVTYLWNTTPAQTTAKAINLRAGVYTVVLTDAKMCTATYTDTVKEASAIKVFFSKKDLECLSDENGSARVDSIKKDGVLADLSGYTFLWDTKPPQTNRQAVQLSYGIHFITLTNDKGCAVKDSIFIEAKDSIPPTIQCPKDIDMTVHAIKTADGSPNTVVVDLGKPVTKDNCNVVKIANDAPEKFRAGKTVVTWTVTDQVGLTDTCQQIVNIREFPTIPQLISPNGDGINDTFVIEGIKGFPQSQLLIFTRSGQLVYQSNDYQNDWDGRYGASTFSHNKLVAPGVYYYILTLGGGTKQKVQGYVYVYY